MPQTQLPSYLLYDHQGELDGSSQLRFKESEAAWKPSHLGCSHSLKVSTSPSIKTWAWTR